MWHIVNNSSSRSSKRSNGRKLLPLGTSKKEEKRVEGTARLGIAQNQSMLHRRWCGVDLRWWNFTWMPLDRWFPPCKKKKNEKRRERWSYAAAGCARKMGWVGVSGLIKEWSPVSFWVRHIASYTWDTKTEIFGTLDGRGQRMRVN